MAKKKASVEETEEKVVVTSIDPCWRRHPSKPVSFCTVTIDVGGCGWAANAEFTEEEERTSKDLPALKLDRLYKAFLSIQADALEYLHG